MKVLDSPNQNPLRIGLIADTHDNIPAIRKALKIFKKHNVHHILHLGDLSSPDTAWEFTGLPTSYILGNNEFELVRLRRVFEATSIEYLGEQEVLCVDGKTLCLYHGTRHSTLQRLIREQQYDYLLKGHSHVVEDYTIGRTRVLNPGALWRVQCQTVAVFEPQNDTVQVLSVV